jgi:Protein of unknown function (DUF3987)
MTACELPPSFTPQNPHNPISAKSANFAATEEEPLSLGPATAAVPFPVAALPAWVTEMVRTVAVATQTDPGMAGTVALGALAAAAGGRAVVNVRPGWREPVNLFTVTAAEPGSRKSAVFQAMTHPLQAAEASLVEKTAASRWEAAVQREVAIKAAEAAIRKAGAADRRQRDELLAEAITAREHAEAITVPPEPRLLADDATPEAIASLLAEHGGRLAIISAEGGLFDVLAGRYSKAPNIEAVLKGHAGDMLRVDRKGRRSEHVRHPALTLALTVQPFVLQSIGRIGEFSGRGLLARFLYALPPSTVGARQVGAPPVPVPVADRYDAHLQALVETLDPWQDPMVLTLSPEAAALHLDAERRLEPRLGRAGDLAPLVEWASKLMGAVARIAGLLHLAEHGGEAAHHHPISGRTMQAALDLGAYFTEHARVAFDLMGADRALAAARELLAHVHAHGTEETSVRDLFTRLSRTRFPKTEDVIAALDVLELHGWAAALPLPPTTGRGRPPSPRYKFHPPT